METKVSSRGQIVLPKSLREMDGIRPGQRFAIERMRRGEFVMRALKDNSSESLIDTPLSCPAKGYFVPVESELTDSL